MIRDTIRNSIYSVFSQILSILLQFVVRYFLLKLVGVEMLGIGGTITSIIGVMALAEGGFGTAIAYCLYKPLGDDDREKINQLMNVFQKIYNILALLVMSIGVLLLPFLRFIIKGIEITNEVYLVFFLLCMNSSASYFLCYKRTLLYADVKEYICKKIDMLCNVVFSIIEIIFIIWTKNYISYVVIMILQTIVANLFIHYNCKRIYPYLSREKFNQGVFREVVGYVKNLFAGNVAGYIYNSTDNIIISSFTNTVNVGYLSNYTMVSTAVRQVVAKVLAPITPTIGKLNSKESDLECRRKLFFKYNQLCYLLAFITCVPTCLLLNMFVVNVYGLQYEMESSISILLTMIIYIYIAPFAYGDFITTTGNFDLLRKVEIFGAALNLIASITLVNFWGIKGVLLGTVISSGLQWIIRSWMVIRQILEFKVFQYIVWFIKGVYRLLLVVLSYVLLGRIFENISINLFILEFIIEGIVSVVVSMAIYLVFYHLRDKLSVRDIYRVIGKSGRGNRE